MQLGVVNIDQVIQVYTSLPMVTFPRTSLPDTRCLPVVQKIIHPTLLITGVRFLSYEPSVTQISEFISMPWISHDKLCFVV